MPHDIEDWRHKAACRNHPAPDLWFPRKRDDSCDTAKEICATCPVKWECGVDAVNRGEKHAVAAGHSMLNSREAAALRNARPRPRAQRAQLPVAGEQRKRVCGGCGKSFESRRALVRCPACAVGAVSVEPVSAHIARLAEAGRMYSQIAADSGVPTSTVSGFMRKKGRPQFTAADIAERILAVPVPDEARL